MKELCWVVVVLLGCCEGDPFLLQGNSGVALWMRLWMTYGFG